MHEAAGTVPAGLHMKLTGDDVTEVLGGTGEIDEAEVRAWAKERLSAYKVPRSVEFRDELPKTAALKILRRQLAQEAREARSKAGSAG